jgi:hypothetical protein
LNPTPTSTIEFIRFFRQPDGCRWSSPPRRLWPESDRKFRHLCLCYDWRSCLKTSYRACWVGCPFRGVGPSSAARMCAASPRARCSRNLLTGCLPNRKCMSAGALGILFRMPSSALSVQYAAVNPAPNNRRMDALTCPGRCLAVRDRRHGTGVPSQSCWKILRAHTAAKFISMQIESRTSVSYSGGVLLLNRRHLLAQSPFCPRTAFDAICLLVLSKPVGVGTTFSVALTISSFPGINCSTPIWSLLRPFHRLRELAQDKLTPPSPAGKVESSHRRSYYALLRLGAPHLHERKFLLLPSLNSPNTRGYFQRQDVHVIPNAVDPVHFFCNPSLASFRRAPAP